jgi:hypothetical protein
MKTNRKLTICLAGIALVLGLIPVAAQEDGTDPGPGDQPQERQRLREQIRERIQQDPALDPQQRARMEQNLERCLRLGLDDEQVAALFPMSDREGQTAARHMLQWQERVMTAAEAGLAEDLLTDKLREGRMKGVDPTAIDGAMDRLQQHLRLAHREMTRAVEDGVTPSPDGTTERQLQRGMAMGLWRGLNEQDLEHLREQARVRARDGSCSMVDLAAAAETTTDLVENGIGHERSREMTGAAIQQGFTAREIRELGHVVRVAARRGGPPEEMVDWLQNRLRYGESMDGLVREMMHHGWLGPRDMSGPGGNSPVDNVIGGPGRHGSGPGGDPGSGNGSSGNGSNGSGSGNGN